MPIRPIRAATLVACAVAVGACVVLVNAAASPDNARGTPPTTRELVGQRFMVAMHGTQPSPALLGRVRRGELGGIILFGANITSRAQLRSLAARLQQTARAAGRPPLLIATDQEGGSVRRVPWAGPELSTSELGRLGAARIRREARLAGAALRQGGINVDLAPVADVPAEGSFMAAENRTFSRVGAVVSRDAAAFAKGLADARVGATVKHFPGIGSAVRNTDRSAVTIAGSRASLEAGIEPFRAALGVGVPIVMISNATYTALDPKPAPWSPRIQAVLRGELGFDGVTISDALDAAATTRGRSLGSVAVLVAQAGMDVLLFIGSEAASATAFDRVATAAEQGRVPAASLQRSYLRILDLKQTVG